MSSFSALTELFTVAEVECGVCRRGTRRADNQDESCETVLRTTLTSGTSSFSDLVREAFAEAPTTVLCRRCKTTTPRTVQWKILTPPEVLLLDVFQGAQHPKDATRFVKPGLQVPTIPEELDLGEYLHEVASTTARYRLTGVINHTGANPDSGHYVSHVRNTYGSWFLLDDSAVSPSSVANLQKYDPVKGANQMIPRLIAYVKIHDDEDNNAIATRAAYLQPGPRAFKQPQILYDEWMTVDELKALCKTHSLVPGNAKTGESLRKLIGTANSAESTFTNRLKGWLITALLSTGTTVATSKTKLQLAAQLRGFMKTQPAQTQALQPSTGSRQRPGVKQESKPSGEGTDRSVVREVQLPVEGQNNTVTREALDNANARIAELEQTLADLQRRMQTVESRRSDRSRSEARSPRTITSDQVRELIQRLPASPSVQRGTKRPAPDDSHQSPETQKRRAIQLAGEVCAAIDAVGQQGPNDNRRDSDQENRRPSGNITTPSARRAIGHLRCHRCPTIAGEIHHMHATVCGWQPGVRVSPPTASEIAEDTALIKARRSTNVSGVAGESSGAEEAAHMLPEDGDETREFLNGDTAEVEDGDETRAFLDSAAAVSGDGHETDAFLMHDDGHRNEDARRPDSIPSDGESTQSFLRGDNLRGGRDAAERNAHIHRLLAALEAFVPHSAT